MDFGARIYDSRLGRWLSLDPLSSKYPSLSPYNFVANNTNSCIDPDGKDIVYLNSKGGISKVVNDGSSHISIIDINGVKSSMSGWNISRSIFYWNNRNRKVIANIGGYYGALIGIKDIGATYSNDGTALAYAIPDVGIWLCPQKDGFTDKSLDNKFNLFVILIHENDHKSHVKDFKETFLSHSATYIKAMTSEYFVKSDENFQQGQVGSLIYHLYNAIENGENTKQSVESLVKEFNDKNGAGWEIADHYESGKGWKYSHKGVTNYILPNKLEKPEK